MSEKSANIQNKKQFRNNLANMALVAAIAGGTGAAIEHGMSDSPASAPQGISRQAVEQIAHDEAAKEKFAEQQAAGYTKSLNTETGSGTALMSILNGEVQVTDAANSPGHSTSFYPIILFPAESVQPNAKVTNETLENQWIGLTSWDANGQITVQPFYFEKAKGMNYISHNDSTPVFAIEAWAQASKGDENSVKGGPAMNSLYAYDRVMQQTLNNPDGTPVIPGYTDSMK